MGKRDCNPKMPITCKVLRHILTAATHSSLLEQLNFEATVMTAFSGFLRCSEFTVQPGKAFDPGFNITRSCVQFWLSLLSPSHVILTILSSKMDPFRKDVAVTIASAPSAHTCTVAALKALSEYVQQPPESPLFIQADGTPLSCGVFISQLKSSLMRAGYDVAKFSGHSFHHGTASSATAVGFSHYEIQQLGR